MEILFRGLRTDGKGWVEGSFLKELYNSYIVECVDQTREAFTYISVNPLTVGQFTGVWDKNRKGVFGGDKFLVDGVVMYVEYSKDRCRYVLTTGRGYDSKNCIDLDCDVVCDLEITGNIHEG